MNNKELTTQELDDAVASALRVIKKSAPGRTDLYVSINVHKLLRMAYQIRINR